MDGLNIVKKEEEFKDNKGNIIDKKEFLVSENFYDLSVLDNINDILNKGYVESIDIKYDIDDNIKQSNNSDKIIDKINSSLLKFNKSKTIPNLKELKFYLNKLKNLIEKCTFEKPVYTLGGKYIYDDDIKFNERLAEIYGCNVKNFKIKVYVNNIDLYYKNNEDEKIKMSMEPQKGSEIEFKNELDEEKIKKLNKELTELNDYDVELDKLTEYELKNLPPLDLSKYKTNEEKEKEKEKELNPAEKQNSNYFNNYKDIIKNLK